MWLTRLALRNPIFVLMLSLMTVALGMFCLTRLSVDLFPDIEIPQVRVAAFYPGAGPEEIEKSLLLPLERAISAVPGVERLESGARTGVGTVTAWFPYGTNLDNAQFEVSQRLAQAQGQLPPGLATPTVIKFDVTNIPVLQVALASETRDERQLYELAADVIEPQLVQLPGVASAAVSGGRQREVTVEVDGTAARARGVGLLDVVGAVRGANLLLPGGHLVSGDRDDNVYINTQVRDPQELTAAVVRPGVATPEGRPPVRLGEVAQVREGTADQTEVVRVDGRRGVVLRVQKQPGANTIAVVDAVRAALPKLRGLPEDVQAQVSFDQSSYIRAAVKSLQHEAVQGGLLAVAVILFFLLSLRATAIVAVSIPLSIVATFGLLYFTGQSLNIFTLGGLALGVGRLVDDSIVELENIHRHLVPGRSRREAVLAAAQEVAMPILVSTVTTVVVFVPVLFLAGVARSLFAPLALTISFALGASFVVSRMVTPVLCHRMLEAHDPWAERRGLGGAILRFLDAMDQRYERLLAVVLRHKVLTIVVILGIFGASLPLWSRIGREFFPAADESQFTVIFKGPVGSRVERTEQLSERVEQAVAETLGPQGEQWRNVVSNSGMPGGRTALYTFNSAPHTGNLQVNLVSPAQRDQSDVALMERLRGAVKEKFPGVQLFFSSGGIVKRIVNMGTPAPIDVEILGQDVEAAAGYARGLVGALKALQGADGKPLLTDVQMGRDEAYPEVRVAVDRQKAGELGLSAQDVAQSVLTGLVGSSAFAPVRHTDPRTGREAFVNVRLAESGRDELQDLRELPLRAAGGVVVPLETVASVQRTSGPVSLARRHLQRMVEITADVAPGADLGSASVAVRRLLEQQPPPDGLTATLSGQAEAQEEAFGGLGMAGLLALALVYMVLASQFRSLVDPLVILFSVPLGITGVALALWLTGTTLSVNSFMGVIMMVGIVVSNGVLLVDYANTLRRRGFELDEAVLEAGRTRLRPILMTTIATVVGLLPMAMGLGEGSEANLPLARAVIGGLTVSTFFTLFLVPALYVAFDRFTRRDWGDDEAEAVDGVTTEAAHA